MLQVRITPNQFLLNNILSLLGISFESLFDKAQLPGAADEPVFDTDLSGKEETGKKVRDLLLQINDKLDKILLKQDRGRTYQRFSKHFSELTEYIYFLRYIFDYTYDTPCENGFSFQKGDKSQELSAKQIYSTNYYFISWQIKKLHGRDKIHRSFANMATCKNNTYEFGRLASPFFILALLLHLLINLMNSGIINKKAIFQIFSENISSNLFKTTEHDNKTASDLFKNAYTETSHVIQNIQKKELNVTNELCVKCEKLCVNFFNNTEKLFSNLIPIQFRINDILNNINTRIELERKLEDSFGTIATFGIQQGWLDYLDKYIEDMGEFQISLGKYYVENEEAISK
jgi:hypothetical protein